MKKADVQINATYLVKVAGNLVPVKITREHDSGGWEVPLCGVRRNVELSGWRFLCRVIPLSFLNITTGHPMVVACCLSCPRWARTR